MTTLRASPSPGATAAAAGRIRMAWITWRQHRMALAGVAILLGGVALALGITGLRMQAAYARVTADGCAAPGLAASSRCAGAWTAYAHAGYPLSGNLELLLAALYVIPPLIGMFVGAPLLAREYESGTGRFAWTQAAGRTRWVVAKLVLLGAALIAAAAAFGALVSWWLSLDNVIAGNSRWQADQFGLTPVTFAAWTLLAFAVGVFAGALIRRTVPAMAATAGAVAALALVAYWKLDKFLVAADPVIRRVALTGQYPFVLGARPPVMLSGIATVVTVPPGSWPLSAWFAGPGGRTPGYGLTQGLWNLSLSAQNGWLARHHLTLWAAYQPAGRFWVFQSAEAGAGLALALALGAATVWLVRRQAA